MLRIIMGSEYAEQYIKDKKFIEFPKTYFNELKKSSWFQDKFVQEIIEKIDKAYVELGYSVRSIEYDCGYSVNDLSNGCKFLILSYILRDNIYLATMGDNCIDFLERITADYEKQGKDLTIVTNYLHKFKLKHIDSIEYINWDIVCHSWDDIEYKIYDRWLKQERADRKDDDDEDEDYKNLKSFDILDKIMAGASEIK